VGVQFVGQLHNPSFETIHFPRQHQHLLKIRIRFLGVRINRGRDQTDYANREMRIRPNGAIAVLRAMVVGEQAFCFSVDAAAF